MKSALTHTSRILAIRQAWFLTYEYFLYIPEVDFDVEEYQGDEGRDPEDDSEGQVHVELDVHRVVPETVQRSPLTVTPSGHGKSVTVTRLSL